ncbi:hypothetical protein Tco_1126254 [Tanacetum coccineum]
MEQELRLKREAAERAFEAQAEKDRTLMRLEELRFLATSTKDLDDDDAYWIKKQKRLIKNKMRNDLGDEDDENEVFFNGFSRVCMAILTCMVSLGGAIVGTITGAVKGPTTETGLVRGACVGAVTGAITALQLMDMIIDGEPFSKVSLLSSLVNGQVFTDWVTPAVLKAYQWQVLVTRDLYTTKFLRN